MIARSELDLAQEAYAVADQQYKQAQANLADAITQRGYTRIVAPISSTVESVSTQEGETVASSFAAPTFVTLLDLSRLEVWAYVDETDIGRIRVGQKAAFTSTPMLTTNFRAGSRQSTHKPRFATTLWTISPSSVSILRAAIFCDQR